MEVVLKEAPAPKSVDPLYQSGLPFVADKFSSEAPLHTVPVTTGAAGLSIVLLMLTKSFEVFWSPANCDFKLKV